MRYHDHSELSVLDYRLPNGIVTGYQGAVEWLKRQEGQ